ncbi:HIT family protein [Dehalogenimonas etheniformans]|uniref:HIT domain-containing protein n=1 Tax=Dehalogenimonas etheniformans TaxID=1536648 RepID=A0A2P5P589_9CHLR|nr:HIT domain-containing protein [Dehalogenimonas etheniformans]PPD57456.1 HIT domain-containing protein [Dehalogenimonas etheniformans]QNT76819.1 HIT domain-containing protein [Dehalogenimonas etheniformans]
MEQIWAPWRMQLIEGPKKDGCIFCDLPGEGEDRKNLVLHRGKQAFVIMNAFPYTAGHLMVAPFRHVARLADLTPGEKAELMDLVAKCETVLSDAMRPEGFNVGFNLGRAAGAGVDKHLHCHIVPRWVGDTNFMPVLGETRVINEALDKTYEKLKEYFK